MSRLDHDANVRPWVQAAARAGAVVRWAEVDPATGELPADQYDGLLSDRTRLVAVTAASNLIGTRPDVAAICAKAHAAGALSYVDGVHATPHGPVDVAALGADFYATSAYKWSGPHVGAVVASPELLDEPAPRQAATGARRRAPAKFERGTLAFADLAGVAAAVDHLASLDAAATGTRRERIVASMTAVEAYESDPVRAPRERPRRDGTRHHVYGGRLCVPRLRASTSPAGDPARSPGTSPSAGSTSGTATTTPGSWPASSGSATAGERCGPASCTTTTSPTWTGCWKPSPSWGTASRGLPRRSPRRTGPESSVQLEGGREQLVDGHRAKAAVLEEASPSPRARTRPAPGGRRRKARPSSPSCRESARRRPRPRSGSHHPRCRQRRRRRSLSAHEVSP